MELDEVDSLERQAGVGLVGRLMDRHYRRSRLNTQIRFNLADVYIYRSVNAQQLRLLIGLVCNNDYA